MCKTTSFLVVSSFRNKEKRRKQQGNYFSGCFIQLASNTHISNATKITPPWLKKTTTFFGVTQLQTRNALLHDGATKTSYYLHKIIFIAKKLLYGAQDLVLTSPGNSLMGCAVHVPAAPTPATLSAATDTLS